MLDERIRENNRPRFFNIFKPDSQAVNHIFSVRLCDGEAGRVRRSSKRTFELLPSTCAYADDDIYF